MTRTYLGEPRTDVEQKRIPDEVVEQIIDWHARIQADRTLVRTAEFIQWVNAEPMIKHLLDPEYRDHRQEILQ